jgi:hypothetical protein
MNSQDDATPVRPLHWPFDWDRMPSLQRFLWSLPVIGPQSQAYRSIARQLNLRGSECREAWNRFSQSEKAIATTISGVVKRNLGWPNDYFIPGDPFVILVWDRNGDLATTEALAQIETRLRLRRRTPSEWESLFGKDFGEVVGILAQEVSAVSGGGTT